MILTDSLGYSVTAQSELVHNVTALAEKSLSERLPAITAKALARAATKFAMAEGVTRGRSICRRQGCGSMGRTICRAAGQGNNRGVGRSRQTKLADVAR